MDRTAELWRVAQLTNPQLRQQHLAPNITGLSDYMKIALRISAALDNTDTIVQKILKLSQQKEFSNDPTTDMTNVSDIFQQRVGIMQADLERLKRHNAQHPSLLQQQHHKLILQSLSNRLSEQLDKFKSAIKLHSSHVQQRQSRIVKYGSGFDQLRAGSAGLQSTTAYAMFSPQLTQPVQSSDLSTTPDTFTLHVTQSTNGERMMSGIGSDMKADGLMHESEKSQELRRRGLHNIHGALHDSQPYGAPAMHSTSRKVHTVGVGGANSVFLQHELLNAPPSLDGRSRLKKAQKIEASIAQMGQLFVQMASLVMEQSETLGRIEDDVEAGLVDTITAHESMNDFYNVTKGNRAMILKVFLLLIFFIVLFIVWT